VLDETADRFAAADLVRFGVTIDPIFDLLDVGGAPPTICLKSYGKTKSKTVGSKNWATARLHLALAPGGKSNWNFPLEYIPSAPCPRAVITAS
jgi:hypothetical protein